MLSIKFDSKSEFSNPEELSPQEIAMAEYGSFIRQYQLTAEEVLEAYRMGIRKQLLDLKGNVIQIYPNLSIIQAGDVLNAYENYKIDNHQHTKGIEKLKLLATPKKEISPEESKAQRKQLLQKLIDAIKENKPCEHSFLFFDSVVKKGGLKSFIESEKSQKMLVDKKMKEIIMAEKMKPKSILFKPFEIKQLDLFVNDKKHETLSEISFAFKTLKAMAVTQVKDDLVYNWFKKKIKNNSN